MPKRFIEAFFLDILVAIDVIKRCTKDMAVPEDILKDEFKYNTILRSFHIIGEAMSHVLDEKSLKESVKQEWRDVVDFRNVVVHEYFGLNVDELSKIISRELPVLEQQILDFIKTTMVNSIHWSITLANIRKELEQQGRSASLLYLDFVEQVCRKN